MARSQRSAHQLAPAAGISLGTALFTALMGAVALAGWVFGNEALKGLGGSITMKGNAALGLIANGLALALVVRGAARLQPLAVGLALLTSAIGGLTLSQHVIGWELGIDELLFSEPPGARATASPGRMGPNASVSLLLTGVAIVCLRSRTRRGPLWAQGLACTAATLATIPLAGYLYGAEQLYSVAQYTGIAFPTALSLLSLSVGILAARSEAGLMATLTAAGPGGVLARRLLLPAIVVPLAIGYVRVLGQRAGLYDTGLGAALFAISVAALFVTLIWRTAVQLNAVDADRRQAEQERVELLQREHRARVEVEHANRLKDHFLAALSHELRTPLNAILGYARMLRSGLIPPDRQAQAIEVIERNGTAQSQLVEELLDMSRITTGRIRLDLEPLPIVAPLQEAIESVQPAIEARRLAFHAALDPVAGNVQGDYGRLRQIFWNVLTNAVKFTPEGGEIHVALQGDQESITIRVRDSGVGIDPKFLPHIFDAFRQADIGSARRYGGLGLGLAICRQLVELHGGSIAAHSDGPGLGATLTIRLPREAPGSAAAEPPQPASHTSALTTRRVRPLAGLEVLVVDDERDSLELARHLLESAGAQVRTAADAAQALRQFDERMPDLLVADVGLPAMDGCELLREMRVRAGASGTHMPAVAVTAFAQSGDRRRTHLAGFEAHIAKPIEPDAFIETVAAVAQAAGAGGEIM
jgi:signal transduction histidine kinase/CheY-like chemotaxis protein